MSPTHAALNLLVPHELRNLIRAEAKRRGLTQRDFVQEAVEAYVAASRRAGRMMRVKPLRKAGVR